MRKYIAEFIGTFTLVLFGTGVAVISSANIIATSMAFGLAIIASAYVIGSISGCHVNPAVSLAMFISRKLSLKDFCGYVVAQIAGAFAGSGLLYYIFYTTSVGTSIGLGANGYGTESIAGISLCGALIVELVLTCIFVYTIFGATKDEKNSSVSGIVIGLTLAFVHMFGIVFTGTSVNPARSLAPAVIMGGTALKQVWVFILAPLAGATLAAVIFRFLNEPKVAKKSKK